MMKEKFICSKCSRSHTVDEYHESRFCRNCGKFLSLKSPLHLIAELKSEATSMPHASDFEAAIKKILNDAKKEGRSYVDVDSGELHRQLGGYPGYSHNMPNCCQVMRRMMRKEIGDKELYSPPRGQGVIGIRYYLLSKAR